MSAMAAAASHRKTPDWEPIADRIRQEGYTIYLNQGCSVFFALAVRPGDVPKIKSVCDGTEYRAMVRLAKALNIELPEEGQEP